MFCLLTRMATPALRQQSARQFSFVALQSATTIQSRMATKPTSALSSYLLDQSAQSPTSTYSSSVIISQLSPLSSFLQRRWSTRGGNRGDTYQPSTLKRKRRLGFLARMRSRTGRKIVKARRDKGRWFLTY